jgi:hypothetical protein
VTIVAAEKRGIDLPEELLARDLFGEVRGLLGLETV